ncbi:MAG: NAD(P)/FAD-dependent oxidoreductase [Hyphomicrobiales bacterium]
MEMRPQVDIVNSDTDLPARADVVVIGGGIVGSATAWTLARRGVSVVLCEKGRIGGEQSSRNWGFCRQQGRDPREIPLIIESLRIWRGIEKEIEAPVGFKQAGCLYLARTDDDLSGYDEWLEHAKPYQLDSRLVTRAEVEDLMPGITVAWKGALYTASDGRAEPAKAAPALAEAARRAGAHVLTGCAVRGVETSGGRVSAAVTEKGTIETGTVVLAGGAWSRLFCGNHGLKLPQLKVLSSAMRTEPRPLVTDNAVWGPGFAFRRRADGGYTIAHGSSIYVDIVPDSFRLLYRFLPALRKEHKTLRMRLGRRFWTELTTASRWSLDETSPFEQTRVLDPDPHHGTLDEAFTVLKRTCPAFAEARVAERWAGLIDVTPDEVPVISPVDDLPGLIVTTGFSGHGFGIGPGAGQLAADLATGATPIVDPAPFRFSRFARGSGDKSAAPVPV